MAKFTRHKLAGVYPELKGEVFENFCEDIRSKGLINPIIVSVDDFIIDGWNRYRATQQLGLAAEDVWIERAVHEDGTAWTDTEIIDYSISANMNRRDMNEAQKALSAASYVNTNRNGSAPENREHITVDAAVDKTGASKRSTERARKVLAAFEDNKIEAEVVEAIRDGRMPVNTAETLIGEPRSIQLDAAANPALTKALTKKKKREDRDTKIKNVAETMPQGDYQVVVMDPPWKFETRSENGMDRSADNHYPTMSIAEIAGKKPPLDLEKQGVLYLWVTRPMLQKAFALIEEWGLEYKSMGGWVKPKAGTGYWLRDNLEPYLICTTPKGFPAPEMGEQMMAANVWPMGEHSAKPDELMEDIEKHYPTAKKLEMYCRSPREGWDAWGLEADGVRLDEKGAPEEGTDTKADEADVPPPAEEETKAAPKKRAPRKKPPAKKAAPKKEPDPPAEKRVDIVAKPPFDPPEARSPEEDLQELVDDDRTGEQAAARTTASIDDDDADPFEDLPSLRDDDFEPPKFIRDGASEGPLEDPFADDEPPL